MRSANLPSLPGVATLGACVVVSAGTLVAADEAAGGGNWVKTLAGVEADDLAAPIRIIGLVTVLSVVPSIVLLTTCFPRLFIVLSFLRRAMGTQDLPPNQVMAGLALILTVMLMLPVWKSVRDEAYVPFVKGEIQGVEAAERALKPLKEFMLSHTTTRDLALFLETMDRAQGSAAPGVPGGSPAMIHRSSSRSASPSLDPGRAVEDLDFFVVLPAFILSELKTAFQMGFLIYLPFLVIDLAVSAILISMGMFMLPPILISLPLKVLVFVLVDGWNIIVTELLRSFSA